MRICPHEVLEFYLFFLLFVKIHYIKIECKFSFWRWVPLEFDNIENIKIYKNNVFIKELDLTSEEGKQWVTIHSSVTDR